MMYIQLAWRYATRRLVNYIAMAAIALALAVQIVAMSVLDGMLADLEKRLRNLGEQITLRVSADLPTRADFDQTAAALVKNIPGVKAVTPLVQKIGFVEGVGGAEYVWVQGIDLAEELKHSSLANHLLDFKPNREAPDWESPDRPGLFMGEQLARRLGVRAGQEIELYNATRGANETGEIEVSSQRFLIKSLIRSGVYERDSYGVYIPIDEAADFYYAPNYMDAADRVEMFVLWLDDPNQADNLQAESAAIASDTLLRLTGADPRIISNTWQQRWSQIAQGMKHENNLMELVLFLNDAASGFCVFAILVTLVSRRIKDVGLLRCIGASRRGVLSVFLMVGLIIGLVGGGLGVLAGCYLAGPTTVETVNNERRFASGGAIEAPLRPGESEAGRRPRIDRYYEAVTGQPLYPPRMFGIADEAGLPIVIYPWKLAIYFFAAIFVSIIAALYPAFWAARREPMSALREG